MKVLFVSPSFYPAFHYGGPTFINRSLCDALAGVSGVEVEVLSTDANGPGCRIDLNSPEVAEITSYRVEYCRRVLRPDIAPGLLLRLPGTIRRAEVVHLNSVYSFTTIPTLALCWFMNKPLMWSTMGALQRWEGSTRQRTKAVWERLCNVFCRPDRVLMHVTSDEEKAESLGRVTRAGAVVIRNGIDLPPIAEAVPRRSGDSLRLLYIGRLHPIKGIENVLRALTLVKTEFRLSICGAGDVQYEAKLKALVEELGLVRAVTFYGRVDGAAKEEQFRQADLCIAPSFKEAFCTVLLEALARSVPVIASRGVPWEKIEAKGCGLWVSNEPEDLAKAIDHAAGLNLSEMGQRGRAWMESEYSWSQVAEETVAEYGRIFIDLKMARESRRSAGSGAITGETNVTDA